MRKLLLLIFFSFLMLQHASSTSIESERILMDLEESRAEVRLNVSELTSSEFTYSTGAIIESVETSSGKYNCRVESQSLGDEIVCDTDLRQNFLVNLSYSFDGLVERSGAYSNFSYTHPIYRSTEDLTMRVRLPERSVLRYKDEVSKSISPGNGEITRDGRNIYVEWNEKPSIGDPLSYRIEYRKGEIEDDSANYLQYIGILVFILALAPIVWVYWKRLNREDIEELYDELSGDEKEVVEMLRQNDGVMLQKDVVDRSDYSKAKISGIVSKLVEKEVILKEKDGRSNKLSISRDFSY